MKKDLVSIIIPSYNSKELLIESVNSVVNQSHKNIEVIVVDDGSNDGTTELFSDFEKLVIDFLRRSTSDCEETSGADVKIASSR
jgi:glycosyltransferase involved in cell wall biosynthesis